MTCKECSGRGYTNGESCPGCIKRYECPACGRGLCWNCHDEELYCEATDCDWTALDGYCQSLAPGAGISTRHRKERP